MRYPSWQELTVTQLRQTQHQPDGFGKTFAIAFRSRLLQFIGYLTKDLPGDVRGYPFDCLVSIASAFLRSEQARLKKNFRRDLADGEEEVASHTH